MVSVQKEKRTNRNYVHYAAKFNEVTRYSNKSFRLKIWPKDTSIEEINDYIDRCNTDRDFFFTELHNKYGKIDRIDNFQIKQSPDVQLQKCLATLPLRKLWENLELDKFFQQLSGKHNRTCVRLSKKENKTNDEKDYIHCGYNLDLTVFLQVADRIINPSSRLATYNNRNSHFIDFSNVELNHIFSSLDILDLHYDSIMKHLNKVANKLFNRNIENVYYDVTTLYFQSFNEDELRAKGMSKDNKFAETQVVLGLLVDQDGLPVSYDLFRGNTAELNTLISTANKAKNYLGDCKLTLVADAGLNQFKNLYYLQNNGFNWLVTYTPKKNLTKAEKVKFLKSEDWKEYRSESNLIKIKDYGSLTKKGYIEETDKVETITGNYYCTFSQNRYLHDLEEIDKNYKRATKLLDNNPSPSSIQSKAGGKTYISLEGSKELVFNQDKFENDKVWAGYSGYYTNIKTEDPSSMFSILRHLYIIENNFRTLKHTFKTRPMYVYTPRHVRGHILSCILSLFLLRTLELILKNEGVQTSEHKIIKALKSATLTKVRSLKNSPEFYTISLWEGEGGELGTEILDPGTEIHYKDLHRAIPFFKICKLLGINSFPLLLSRIELMESLNLRCRYVIGVTGENFTKVSKK